MHLGALAGDLGSFPLDRGPYHPRTHSRAAHDGIRSLVGVGNLVGPLAHPVLYPRRSAPEAVPQYISGRTSYRRV